MTPQELEDFEIRLLLDSIEYRWGYDFREYAQASIKRRIDNARQRHRLAHISELIPRILHDAEFFQDVVRNFSITVTEMFRDPHVWLTLREQVLPMLNTWPYFKVWHAACATGEEAYSMAILLDEAGLLERATIYATDFNDEALHKGHEGIYALKHMQNAERNYRQAGGLRRFDDYYFVCDDVVQMRKSLRDKIVWSNHNLVQDQVFGEMNLILCRNALIYFSQPLQNRVLELFRASLVHGGFLCLGSKESLTFASVRPHFEAISQKNRVFRHLPATHEPDTVRPVHLALDREPARPIPGVLVIGCSMGGIKALQTLLRTLPVDFPLPVLITQHIAHNRDSELAGVLKRNTTLSVKEAEHGERIRAGWVYLAPPDYHLLLEADWSLSLNGDESNHHARPSINVMFESVARICARRTIGLLLTGANDDGAVGLAVIHAEGGYTVVQNPDDAEHATMPLSALRLFQPDAVLPLADMVAAIQQHLRSWPDETRQTARIPLRSSTAATRYRP